MRRNGAGSGGVCSALDGATRVSPGLMLAPSEPLHPEAGPQASPTEVPTVDGGKQAGRFA